MSVVGYDPGLSIEKSDSIANAVRDADYISINIPYIKGEGGAHDIIGKEVVDIFESGAVLKIGRVPTEEETCRSRGTAMTSSATKEETEERS